MSSKGILSVFVLVLVLFAVFANRTYAVEDWPGYRGPNYDGTISSQSFTPETNELVVSWRAKGGTGYSGISIADGKAVTGFTDGKNDLVAAFNSRTGKELWRYQISKLYTGHDGSHDGPIATPLLHQGKVFALSALREANKNFFAFLKEKGYSPVGGETHEGYGWGSWRNRTDRWLVHLFPM